jgi:Cu(I)/Ag(I) efflux system membrane protein CusA/SilA
VIGKIIEASAKNRALVLIAALCLALAGLTAMRHLKLDATPDLSDPQVIVLGEWMGRSPMQVEEQLTYPLVTALLSVPHVVDVRGQSMFGMSLVYVVFEENTDLYWARSRVLEHLNTVAHRLPTDATTRMGPDATGVGWIYQYALVDRNTGPERRDSAQLRALQDNILRHAIGSVPGVAEVATVGGFESQYELTLDPIRLQNSRVSIADVVRAVRAATGEVGARVLELSEREYFVRGHASISRVQDLERVVVRSDPLRSVLVSDVARVSLVPQLRRGAADLDGQGEAVSGIVVMRYGENALEVIDRVERKITELRATLPPGVQIVTVYDRSGLIRRAIETLKRALGEEMLVVALAIVLFLLHVRSALLPIVSLPLAVLGAFVPMYFFGIPATIMSLGGIAIAIGATVDAEIVMVEAAHKKLENTPADLPKPERERLLSEAAREVTPAIFFSLLIIAASFLPVFGLTGQAGRLFKPLAFTKTFVMLTAALLSITVAPALREYLIRGRIRAEKDHPISRAIRRVYEPFVHVALSNPKSTVLIGLMAVLSAVPLAVRLGSEFMPPLDEGDILYMPTTFANISIEEARLQLQRQDRILRSFSEVQSVLGKVGRADTVTDPAPLSMIETVVRLRPASEWPTKYVRRWYVGRTPLFLRPLLNWLQPEFVPKTREDIAEQMNAQLQLAGWTNAFTQPIRSRVDMLSTGIRTPVGIKIFGSNLGQIEATGQALEGILHRVPGTRSVLFERSVGGLYVDIRADRERLARYGLQLRDVTDVLEYGVGAMPITTIEGHQRVTVSVRLAQHTRQSVDALRALRIPLHAVDTPTEPASAGHHVSAATDSTTARLSANTRALGVMDTPSFVTLGTVADISIHQGPAMIRDEAAMLVGYVYVDVDSERDVGGYVTDARLAVERARAEGQLTMPTGGYLKWTGQYELLEQMQARMRWLVPLALLVTMLLLYWQFKNRTEVMIVLLSIPFALVGSVWALWLLNFQLSTAVWVGVIALVGLAAQTGVVMIVYIDQAYHRRLAADKIHSLADIIEAHTEGTIQRVRPKLMTVSTMLLGLLPLLWSTGSGADVMKRIAAPMIGGLVSSAFLTLEIIPVVYTYWRNEQLVWRRLGALTLAHSQQILRQLQRYSRMIELLAALTVLSVALRWYVPSAHIRTTQLSALLASMGFVAALIHYGRTRYKAVALLAQPTTDTQ